MNATGWQGGHPESGELLSLADRGLSAPEHEQLAAHVQDCEYCQRELNRIEAMARTISAALASDDVAPVSDIRRAQALNAVRDAAARANRRTRLRHVWVPRLAAASLVLAFGALAAGPGLALMRSVLRSVIPAHNLSAAPVVVTEPAIPAFDAGAMSWRITASTITLDFTRPGSGLLRFRRGAGAQTAVQVVGASRNSGVGRLGNTIVIDSDTATSPIYLVSLPAHVTQITISVAGVQQITRAPRFDISYDVKELTSGRAARNQGSSGG
jgi:hypothetical protein